MPSGKRDNSAANVGVSRDTRVVSRETTRCTTCRAIPVRSPPLFPLPTELAISAPVHFDTHVRRQLQALHTTHLLRSPRAFLGTQGPELSLDGRHVLNFCSNNYLGLAADPRVTHAATAALARLGVGSGASRHVCGTEHHHLQAENQLAHFCRLPAARLFSSGYAANIGTLQALCGPGDLLFSDAFNHASLIDGCRLSRATVHVFPHRDYAALAGLLKRHRGAGRASIILTDALFSMDGTLADLPTLRRLADQHQSALLVDEAHSLGVLGPSGAGHCAASGVRPDVLTGMLGKAFGLAGGFAAANEPVIRLIENRARPYVFSTAPPPHLAAATVAASHAVAQAGPRRTRLRAVTLALHRGLRDLGFHLPASPTHILPVLTGDPDTTMALSDRLLELGVFVHGIRPPSVPPGTGRLRLTALSTHTDEHVQRALDAFAQLPRPRLPAASHRP